MAALVEARYDDLKGLFPEFRSQLSHKCNNQNFAAHDAHITLIIIRDELTSALEEVTGAVVRVLKRALMIVQNLISHVKLRIVYPQSMLKCLPNEEPRFLNTIASSGKLTKKQVIALGYAVYEAAYINSGINRTEFIVDLGKCFNMKITESYARTAITDIRNDFKDGVPYYFAIFGERLAAKMEKLNDESDEAYDRKIRESRLANKK